MYFNMKTLEMKAFINGNRKNEHSLSHTHTQSTHIRIHSEKGRRRERGRKSIEQYEMNRIR